MNKDLEWIDDFCHEHRVTKADVGRALGVTRQAINSMRNRNVSVVVFVSMCRSIGVEPGAELTRLLKAGFIG